MFGPSHSVIVPYEYLDRSSFDDFEVQTKVLKEHYRFAKLSEVVDRLARKKRQGLAAIVFENPRQGVLTQAVPVLLSWDIPFTIFIDPDYVGLNRLPILEELAAYRSAYPEGWTEEQYHQLIAESRDNPSNANDFLKQCREKLGPLPVEKLDPLSFFCTWGRLVELPPLQVEFGLRIHEKIGAPGPLLEKIQYFESQLKVRPKVVRAPAGGLSLDELKKIREVGIQAVIGHRTGEVRRDSLLEDLPIWNLR